MKSESSERREPAISRMVLLLVASIVVLADQGSKFFISNWLQYGDVVPIVPGFFNLVLTYNKGVAFGVFAGVENEAVRYAILGTTTLIALVAVFIFSRAEGFEGRIPQTALAMIVGGAVGNMIDRVRIGMVTDFLDFYLGTQHWPAFNIADSAICIAVILLLFFSTPEKTKS